MFLFKYATKERACSWFHARVQSPTNLVNVQTPLNRQLLYVDAYSIELGFACILSFWMQTWKRLNYCSFLSHYHIKQCELMRRVYAFVFERLMCMTNDQMQRCIQTMAITHVTHYYHHNNVAAMRSSGTANETNWGQRSYPQWNYVACISIANIFICIMPMLA